MVLLFLVEVVEDVCVDGGVRVSGMASNTNESSATSGGRPK